MAATASDKLTPEAVWKGLRPDWLIAEKGKGDAFEQATCAAQANKAINQQWFEQVSHRRRQLERHQLENYHPSPFNLQPSPHVPSHLVPPHLVTPPLVLIAETHPADILASVLAAALAGWNMALANARWGTQEWQALSQLVSPNIVFGENSPIQPTRLAAHSLGTHTPAILIPTGGSSGQVKLVHHTWASLMASVTGFRQHFTPNSAPINTYCTLPVHHVSGLMQVLRAWTSHGQVTLTAFKTLEAAPRCNGRTSDGPLKAQYISLVPTQLHRLLEADKGPWLSQCQAVLLGGAPPWPTLLARAAEHHIPLHLSYGMTETAAMVTAFKLGPVQSLENLRINPLSSGTALPHATIEIVKDGRKQPPGDMGQVVVHSHAIAQGYYAPPSQTPSGQTPPGQTPSGQTPLANCSPGTFYPGTFYTDDLGYLSDEGHLYITGRASGKIISGGENIFPAEVEAALRSTGQIKDICIIGLPHQLWGEVVTAVYVPIHKNVSPEQLKQSLCATGPHETPILSRYKHPKRWIPLETLPRNEQGKLNRIRLLELIQAQLDQLTNPTVQPSADDGGGHRP